MDHWYYQASTGGYFCQGLVLSLANLRVTSPLALLVSLVLLVTISGQYLRRSRPASNPTEAGGTRRYHTARQQCQQCSVPQCLCPPMPLCPQSLGTAHLSEATQIPPDANRSLSNRFRQNDDTIDDRLDDHTVPLVTTQHHLATIGPPLDTPKTLPAVSTTHCIQPTASNPMHPRTTGVWVSCPVHNQLQPAPNCRTGFPGGTNHTITSTPNLHQTIST